MAIKLGSTNVGSLYLGSTKIGQVYLGSVKIYESSIVLPAKTLRLQFTNGVTPTFTKGTATQVSSSPNIWDLTYDNDNWDSLLSNQTDLIKVVAGNTTGVTSLNFAFYNCTSLVSVPLLDTSSVTYFSYAFYGCSSLQIIPQFVVSSALSAGSMFSNCTSVESGAYEMFCALLYTGASAVDHHPNTFNNCGSNTVTGSSDLSKIPPTWGGTMALNSVNTLRVLFSDGVTPTLTYGGTATRHTSHPNVWDITNNSVSWYQMLKGQTELLEVWVGNTSQIYDMSELFTGCTKLREVGIFDTSNVEWMWDMFSSCTSLKKVPRFDTSRVTNMQSMFMYDSSLTSVPDFNTPVLRNMSFLCYRCTSLTSMPDFTTTGNVTEFNYAFQDCTSLTTIRLYATGNATRVNSMLQGCRKVSSNITAFYNQMANQATPPQYHGDCFTDCGADTQSGRSQLNNIPSSWGGTMIGGD